MRYRNESDYTNDVAVLMLSQLLGSTFAGTGGFEGSSIAQAATSFETALGNGGFDGDVSDETRPFAYLNYILFNDNQEMVDAGWQRVPVEAGFDPGEEGLPDLHRRVAFEEPIDVTETGYIYVWVSNESENVRVWFDDLTISHSETILVQATDYGVWGDVLREQKTDQRVYRYGYQGQFAERDEETGWNHFELREYDVVIGRWLVPDVYKVHWSPYLAMNNNPTNSVDPDGGCETGNCPPKQGDIRDNQIFDGDNWLSMGKEAVVNFASDYRFFQQERPYVVDTQRHLNYLFNQPLIKPYEPDLIDRWSESDNFVAKMTYSTVDGAYVTLHFFTPWEPDVHLNGESTQGRDKVMAFASTATAVMPLTRTIPVLNAAGFSTLFKGTFLLKPAIRGRAMQGVNWAIPRTLGLSSTAASTVNSLTSE